MNLTNQESKLPYIIYPEFNLKILIDTGSTKSFVKQEIAKKYFKNFIKHDPFKILTAHGSSFEKFSTTIPCSKMFKTKCKPLKFYLFNFHKYFDCLLGIDNLKFLSASINLDKNLLVTPNTEIPLLFHDKSFSTNCITVQPRCEQIIKIKVKNIQNGDVLIPYSKNSELEKYDYEINCKKRILNKNADALSRIEPNANETQSKTDPIFTLKDYVQHLNKSLNEQQTELDSQSVIVVTDATIHSNIENPINGKYEEPPFISKESRKLIRSMLQVEPNKRIKISELLNHPWLTLGVLDPVEYTPKNTSILDHECVQIIAKFMEIDQKLISNELLKWKYDYNTATYFLLLTRKKKGHSLKLNNTYGLRILKNHEQLTIPLLELPVNTAKNLLTPNQKVKIRRKFNIATSPGYLSLSPISGVQEMSSPSGQFLEPKPAGSESSRKALKRPRSPFLDEASPVPSKKATPSKGTPCRTPDRRKIPNGTTEAPGSARRMLGSIERSLYKVRDVLTPKKPLESVSVRPAVLNSKDLCNVSTTQCRDPELVISELMKGLEKKGIKCTRKGFRLKGSLEPNVLHRFGGCSFELEICYLPNLGLPTFSLAQNMTPTKSILTKGILQTDSTTDNTSASENKSVIEKTQNAQDDSNKGLVGIRRKRLKGDSWCYKKVCEQVLALTCTGFNNNVRGGLLESSV